MNLTRIAASEAPDQRRNTRYTPVMEAVERGESFSIPAAEAKLTGVRNAVKRASTEAAYRVYQEGDLIYVVNLDAAQEGEDASDLETAE